MIDFNEALNRILREALEEILDEPKYQVLKFQGSELESLRRTLAHQQAQLNTIAEALENREVRAHAMGDRLDQLDQSIAGCLLACR